MNLFLVVDDSCPDFPVYIMVAGENTAEDYYNSGFKVFETHIDLDMLNHMLTQDREVTLLDVTANTTQWVPYDSYRSEEFQ